MEKSQEEKTFTTAMEQLHEIANQLERDDIDPDRLVELIRKAEGLIAFCRKKLAETELTVQEILNRLQEAENNGPEPIENDIF